MKHTAKKQKKSRAGAKRSSVKKSAGSKSIAFENYDALPAALYYPDEDSLLNDEIEFLEDL